MQMSGESATNQPNRRRPSATEREVGNMGRKPTQRRPPAKVRRREILDAAAAAFAERGYRGTSLADIAQVVGVSSPALIHHFPSKDSLLIAALEARDEEAEKWLAAGGLNHHPNVAERTRALCRWNAEQETQLRLFVITRGECLDPEHPVNEFFRRRYRRIRDRFTGWIEEDQRAGRISDEVDAVKVATELLAVMSGLEIQWALDPSRDMCAVMDAHLGLLDVYATGDSPTSPTHSKQEETEAH